MAAAKQEVIYISGYRPRRNEIPTAIPRFSGMAYSMVTNPTLNTAPLCPQFKMVAAKPEILIIGAV